MTPEGYKLAKVTCTQCDWRGTNDGLLRAVSPFDSDDILTGCPECKSVDCFRVACDEPGCWRDASCGTPTQDGYRQTCFKHAPQKKSP